MKREEFLSEVPLRDVKVTDSFWSPIMETTRTQMIPYQWRVLNDQEAEAEPSHCIENFKIAAGLSQGEFYGLVFQDSDVAKWMEAAAYSLCWHSDEELEQQIDQTIDLIGLAQQPDGYLGTYHTINGLENRWTNIMGDHEMYCAGHMLEAAVAYYEATGKRKLLDIMIRFVDHIDSVMGPEEGKLHAYPGHEEIELALFRLYYITKDPKHLKLAKYFIDERGAEPHFFTEELKKNGKPCRWLKTYMGFKYNQSEVPVRDAEGAVGHAVRAVYLYTAMADAARETGDEGLQAACQRMWDDIVHRQMYITGAIGSSSEGEAFTMDYHLPNALVYGETCASVGMAFFAKRMLQTKPMGEYADVLERMLYNGTISGMALDGKHFFYVNPLEVYPEADLKVPAYKHVKPTRQKWFACACCPPNLARMVESVGSYIYGVRDNTVFVHLYIGNETVCQAGGKVQISMKTEYPWNGQVSMAVQSEEAVTLALRIPGWLGGEAFTLQVNGAVTADYQMKDGYAYVALPAGASVLELNFVIKSKIMRANQHVRDDFGKVCIQRGPVVYCLEEADNGKELHRLALAAGTEIREEYHPELLGGVTVLQADGVRYEGHDGESLYYEDDGEEVKKTCQLTFVPYYAWNNRGDGEMTVWVRKDL